jgi:ATP-dependent RNA helicase RhlB
MIPELFRRIGGLFRRKEAVSPPPPPSPPRRSVERALVRSWDPSRFEVPPVEGKVRFHDLALPPEVMHAIAELGFRYCTPVQAAILPQALAGRDATGRAQTGTGKTAAFLIAILTRFLRAKPPEKRRPGTPRALILAPTRELVMQIEKDARGLAAYVPCSILGVFGGIDYQKQLHALKERPIDIVVATPGRLLDYKRKGHLNLGKVEVMVIDEADRMLDMGFIPDVRRIVESTPPKAQRQTMLFSATLTPDVLRLASSWTRDAFMVEIDPEQVAVASVDQKVYITTTKEKFTLLYNLITREHLERVLVFTNRRDEAQRLRDRLKALDVSCGLLSGDVEQTKRIKTLEDLRGGRIRVLVATDVAARGLHVENISHVINYNLPMDPEDYVHRIGRTGRAGALGTSVSFACEEDGEQIPLIEKYLGRALECIYPPDEWLAQLPAEPAVQGRTSHARPRRSQDRRGGRRPSGGPNRRRSR